MNFNLPDLTPEMRVDVACAAVILIFVAWGAAKGLSATLARIAALVLAFKLAFLLFPHVSAMLPQDSTTTPAIAFGITVVAALVIHLVIKGVLAKVARVFLPAPIDRIIGAAAGAVKGVLLVFVVFSVIALATGKSYDGTAFAQSKIGSRVVPAVGRLIAPAGAKLPCPAAER